MRDARAPRPVPAQWMHLGFYVSEYLHEEEAYVLDGIIYAGSVSAVLAHIDRELRRRDCVAAFAGLP